MWAFLGLSVAVVGVVFLLQPQEQGSEGERAESVEVGVPGDGGMAGEVEGQGGSISEPSVVPGEVDPFVGPADADEIEAEAESMMDLPLVPEAIETGGMVEPPVEPDEIEAEAESMMDLPLVPEAIETGGTVEPPVEPDEIEAGAERMMDLPLVPEEIETEGMVESPVEPDEIEAEGVLGAPLLPGEIEAVIRAVVREALEARGEARSGLLDGRETGRQSGVPVLRTLPRMALPVLGAPVRVARDGMGYRVPLVVRQLVPDQIRGGVYIPAHETYLVVKPGHWEHHKAAVERDGADMTEFDIEGVQIPAWPAGSSLEVPRGGP